MARRPDGASRAGDHDNEEIQLSFHMARQAAAVLGAFALAAAAHAQDAGMAYVSNQDGDVTVVDLAKLEAVSEIKVGGSPRGIGITSDGAVLVVARRDDGTVAIIDRAGGNVLKTVRIGKNPEFVRVRGDFAFVSFEPASKGGPPPKPGSAEAAKARDDDDDDKDKEPARIAVVDLKQGKVVREIVGGMETEGIEFSADGKQILITNEADENVSVHDIATGKLVKKIDTKKYGNRPRGVKRAPDGSAYVVTLEFSSKMVVLDAKYNVQKVVSTGETPYGVAFDRKGERLYVALAKGKALQVFDAKTFEPVGSAPTGDRCWHFTFTPDDKQILVACGRSNDLVVIDTASLQQVKRIEDKKLPWGVVTYPKAVGSLDWPL
jgi:YVTN family beta-propeller protein